MTFILTASKWVREDDEADDVHKKSYSPRSENTGGILTFKVDDEDLKGTLPASEQNDTVLPKRFTAEQKGKAILIPSDDKAQVPHRPSKQPVKVLSSSSQQSSQRSTITKSSVHKPAATCTTEGAHMIDLSNPFSALDDLIET
ncbi:hypothetical protein DY000_02026077 [Brassica cretica]|uniref:Uncharacterized protein n=1 Tax=Brassica cretica TaxID=69181 RepID=A0ABQ7E531_BRACR|nr:hypothetical protein DY000_02026077 [Brassica cretica]